MVPEMSNAVMRMGVARWAAPYYSRRSRMETVMQVCCRDRNRLRFRRT
ncbi:MAG: hypothetical protein R2874_13050 [Desulfobacterales bacterium]